MTWTTPAKPFTRPPHPFPKSPFLAGG
jgi:hypothetical protein